MDGVSNAAAVIGLVQAGIQVNSALNRYISRVKKAECSRARLLRQVNLISAVEKAIKTAIQTPSTSFPNHTPELQNVIDEWFADDSPPNKCKARLEELSTWLENQVESDEGSKYKRLLKKMGWPAKEDKIEETIKAFDEYMPYFNAILSLVNHSTAVNEAAVSKKAQHTTTKSKLLSWFDAFDCTNKQESTLQQRQEKTGKWLFKEELYIDWCMGSTKFIRLHGRPGAGKSVLTSAVIDTLSGPLKDNETLAYFYCDFRSPRCTSTMEVLRSLTKQLLWSSMQDWLSSFSDLTTRQERGAGPPTDLRFLLDLLKRAATFHKRPILVVDALDECEDLSSLLDALTELVHTGHRLFVTSRTLPTIEDAFRNLSDISLDERIGALQSDIRLHIQVELASRSRLKSLRQDFKDEIQDILMKKAAGMFRLAQCQVDRLNDCYSVRDIHEVLNTLPETLHETYDQMLRTIDKKPFGPRIARRTLMWLVTALVPLNLSKLVEALTLSSDEPAWDSTHAPLDEHVILEILGSFVVNDRRHNFITLSHYSVKEYLTSDALVHSMYYVRSQEASFELAKASIFALILHQSGENELSSYADFYGLRHLANCDAAHNETLVKHLLTLQDHISAQRPRKRLLRESWNNPWMVRVQQVALHVILRHGHLSMLDHYLDHHPIQATPEDNPLVFAIHYSSIASVQLLLEKGLDVNLEGSLYIYGGADKMFPLTAAAQHTIRDHQEPLVQLLLANGCIVPRDAILLRGMYSPWNPSVLQILLDHGADPKSLAAGNDSCLHLLFKSHEIPLEDQLEIAQILVDNGCDPAVLNDKGYSPLIAAARCATREGQERLVQFLLANGCIVPVDAIHATLSDDFYGPYNPAVVQTLLTHGADPKLLATGNNSCLHLLLKSHGISLEDKLEIAQILVDNRCNPAALNDEGHSPLIAAMRNSTTREGQERLVQFLLANGCVVPADTIHATLSGGFCGPCNPAVVQILLTHGADPKLLAAGNNSCLHLLFKSCGISLEDQLEIAQILVDNGCEPAALNDEGCSPLIAAARNKTRGGQERLVQFLLANECIVPPDAIHATLSDDFHGPYNPAVVQTLLTHGADPKLLAAGNNSSLHLLFKSHGISLEDGLEIAQILIDNGCDPAVLNDEGHSRLIAAARCVTRGWQEPLVQFLLESGCIVPVDAILATLSYQRSHSHAPYNPAVVRILLAHGADPTLLVSGNNSSLHLLCKSHGISLEDKLEVVEILVDNKCDPTALNDRGYSPFHHAISSCSFELVECLVDLGWLVPSDAILHVGFDRTNIELHPMLRFLVKNGALPNAQDENGCNALHRLCQAYFLRDDYNLFAHTLQLLVESGCDINSRNKVGKTPFHLALPCPYSSRVVDLFISQGAEVPVDIVNRVVTSSYSLQEVITALTSLKRSGASFQSRTQNGQNALHCLLQSPGSNTPESILEIASFLIESGCDIHASYDGVTPLELAIHKGQFLIAETLSARVASGPGSYNEHAELFHDDSMGNSILHRLCCQWVDDLKFMDKLKFFQGLGYNLTKDINRQNYNGITPLCMALHGLHAGTVTSLLALGASFNHVSYVCLDNIQWASNHSWYPDAIDAHKRYISRSSISCNDVILVQHLLGAAYGCRLSPVVVSSILDMAGYWACMKITKYNIRCDEATRRDRHIAFPLAAIPAEMGGWTPRRVVFTVTCAPDAELSDSKVYYSGVFSQFYVARDSESNKFRGPGFFLALSDLPHTKFVVWSEFQPALHEDGKKKMMLAKLLPGDVLGIEFQHFSEDVNYVPPVSLQIDIYYSIDSLPDECN